RASRCAARLGPVKLGAARLERSLETIGHRVARRSLREAGPAATAGPMAGLLEFRPSRRRIRADAPETARTSECATMRDRHRASACRAATTPRPAPAPARDPGTTPLNHEGPMSWVLLFVAGLLEVAWAAGLKSSEGFTRLWPSVLTVVTA